MTARPVSPIDLWQDDGGRFTVVLVSSVVFHVVVLVVIPLVTSMLWRPQKFARPQTFQLVSMPAPRQVRRQSRPTPAPAKPKEKTPAVKPAVKKDDAAVKPASKPEPEDDMSELRELLGGVQAPAAELSVASQFPYNWYLNNLLSKIERNWKPTTANPELSVVVTFSVYGNGDIGEVRVTTSSGNTSLDNMALRAVRLGAPFGKLPPGYSENRLDINCILRPTKR